jgi:alcohol dehydrogenase class IV
LAVTVDHHQSAASGLDALTQLMEAYTSTRANLYIDSLALGAIGKLGLALPQLLNGHLDDITLREDMAYAAYISGLAIAHAGLGYVHGLAGPLGALHHAPHGVICGKLIGPINAALLAQPESNTYHDKLRCIASLWNLKDPSAVIRHIESIVAQAQFPSLKSYGYTLEELKHIGLANPKRNSPVSLEENQLVAILEQLY